MVVTAIESTLWPRPVPCWILPVAVLFLTLQVRKRNLSQQKQLPKITQLVGVRGEARFKPSNVIPELIHSLNFCCAPGTAPGPGWGGGTLWKTDCRLRAHVLLHYTRRIPLKWVWTFIIIFSYLMTEITKGVCMLMKNIPEVKTCCWKWWEQQAETSVGRCWLGAYLIA